jgi:hypothetical protein
MTDLAFASAGELAAMIRNREISPVEVVRATLRASSRPSPCSMRSSLSRPNRRWRPPERRSGLSELIRWLPPTAARLQASIELNTTHCAICSNSAASFRKIRDTVVVGRSHKIDTRSHTHVFSLSME